jgi:hypothetical protein
MIEFAVIGCIRENSRISFCDQICNRSRKAVRDDGKHSLGIGTTHVMHSVISGILLPSFTCREYTLAEKINMWRGKSRSGMASLWGAMLSTDLSKKVPALEIPVFLRRHVRLHSLLRRGQGLFRGPEGAGQGDLYI